MTVEDYDLPVIMENIVNISGMVSMTKFRASNFNCMAEGFTNTIRSLYFPLYYSLLEKSFCEDVIDGVCHIITVAAGFHRQCSCYRVMSTVYEKRWT